MIIGEVSMIDDILCKHSGLVQRVLCSRLNDTLRREAGLLLRERSNSDRVIISLFEVLGQEWV